MGTALSLCVLLILGLLAMIAYEGLATFWPRPIELVTLRSGDKFLGVPLSTEAFDPGSSAPQMAGKKSAVGLDARPLRRLYRVGNRELGQPFRWVELSEIASVERPEYAVMLERREWGIWLGIPHAVYEQRDLVSTVNEGADSALLGGTRKTGTTTNSDRRMIAEGEDAAWTAFQAEHASAVARFDRIEKLTKADIGAVNQELETDRLQLRQGEIAFERSGSDRRVLPIRWWCAALVAFIAVVTAWRSMARRRARPGLRMLVRYAAPCIAVPLLLLLILERPFGRSSMTQQGLDALRSEVSNRAVELQDRYHELFTRIQQIRTEDERFRAEFVEPVTGRFAPSAQSTPDSPLIISQVVRAVAPNRLSTWGKWAVYFDRWREFLFADPRNANTEGGVFPVIVGTVLLTVLLSILVVPLGVVAAIYLREYARIGPVTSFVRIAVNNLAGVPSIVYGVFGVGFFCYIVGKYIDAGPVAPRSVAPWWLLLTAAVAVVFGGLAFTWAARPRPGEPVEARHRALAYVAGTVWACAGLLVAGVFATTPYFHGFFEAGLPSPTFGTRGLLWASLTLALMTLPVVIVATEESIAAVPRTMREGSYGCGASKWQTIKRIVLPGAMPGIMTGMILAMARGAGEVAPLMLVGAVKLAPELPFSTSFPFLHPQRSFMHLGFHIFDLGFQSPDSEAARPLVWTTTLLLICIVVLLNLVAIVVRGRLRRKLVGSQF